MEEFLKKYENVKTRNYYKKAIELLGTELDYKKVNDFLESSKYSKSTQASFLGAYLQYLKYMDLEQEKIKGYKQILEVQIKENKPRVLSDSYVELLDKFEKYKFVNINHKILLASLLYGFSPRSADIFSVDLVDSGTNNYLDIKKAKIVYRETVKTKYKMELNIPKFLIKDLKKLQGPKVFNIDIKRIDNYINKSLKLITFGVFGKVILSNELRKIRETYLQNNTTDINEKIKISASNGHTYLTFKNHYELK